MDNEETMVENEDFETEADDTLPESIEEEDESEEESLDSLSDEEDQEEQPEEQPQQQQASEPGWIKQRVNKAVQKAVAETEARMQAMFEQQMAPIREKMLLDEAKELVRQGEFKSLDRAKEYLQLKQGVAPAPAPQEQPRNEQGQFAPKQDDPGTSARVDMLAHQADAIKADTGFDVIDVFTNDEEIKQKVISGEMDFYDVAKQMKQSKRRPPAPMRSPNGATGSNPNAIDTMSDEQFEKMEKRIREGARYALK